tara:strand:+ start:379 stop:963 length:585 start_codon:yes stop_codon:yes gene_type:complete
MKVTIHQPTHFPYTGFFHKMASADIFVILDTVKFCKGEFYNRNRFTNKQGISEWFTVPVEKEAHKKMIKDVKVSEDFGWRKKLLKQMKFNFGKDFSEIYESEKLVDINIKGIEYCRKKLRIDVPMIKASDMNLIDGKTERLVDICKQLNATEYISGQSGKEYLNEDLFGDIKVSYFESKIESYDTTLVHIRGNK